jgi:hypothetical protein
LIDGIIGTANWKTGEWQSYFAKDFEAVIDLKATKPVSYVAIHVLQDIGPWIIFPKEVIFETSEDGKNFQPLTTVTNTILKDVSGPLVQELGKAVTVNARYIKVKALTGGALPATHEAAGSPSHIFIDEFIIK